MPGPHNSRLCCPMRFPSCLHRLDEGAARRIRAFHRDSALVGSKMMRRASLIVLTYFLWMSEQLAAPAAGSTPSSQGPQWVDFDNAETTLFTDLLKLRCLEFVDGDGRFEIPNTA